MIEYIESDLFEYLPTVLSEHEGPVALPHVVNSEGVMGAGFVVPLKNKYPEVEKAYVLWHRASKALNHPMEHNFQLGQTQFVEVGDLTVCNMLAQYLGGPRPLRYNALASCMDQVAKRFHKTNAKLVCPAFGSSLACGNWSFITELIQDCWSKFEVVVCYRPGEDPRKR